MNDIENAAIDDGGSVEQGRAIAAKLLGELDVGDSKPGVRRACWMMCSTTVSVLGRGMSTSEVTFSSMEKKGAQPTR